MKDSITIKKESLDIVLNYKLKMLIRTAMKAAVLISKGKSLVKEYCGTYDGMPPITAEDALIDELISRFKADLYESAEKEL